MIDKLAQAEVLKLPAMEGGPGHGGGPKKFAINPLTPMDHSRARFRPGVVQEHPPAPHASAGLSAAASDAACTVA